MGAARQAFLYELKGGAAADGGSGTTGTGSNNRSRFDAVGKPTASLFATTGSGW